MNLKNIRLIIDVGANKGQSIQFFLKNFPDAKIIGFEPNERLNKFLKKLEDVLEDVQYKQKLEYMKKNKMI